MNKNKTKTLLAALFAVIVLATAISGCTKPSNTPATCSNGIKDGNETGIDCGGSCNACNVNGVGKIKTIATPTSSSTDVDTLYYNSDSKQIGVFSNHVVRTTTTYGSNTVTQVTVNAPGDTTITTYSLNSQGYATSSQFTSNNSSGTAQYTYDASGQLLTKIFSGQDSFGGTIEDTTFQTWNGGNVVSSYYARYYSTALQYYSIDKIYTYFASKNNTIGNESQGIMFLGKDSKNPVNVETDLTNSLSVTHTYLYDANNRITKDLSNNASYTYY